MGSKIRRIHRAKYECVAQRRIWKSIEGPSEYSAEYSSVHARERSETRERGSQTIRSTHTWLLSPARLEHCLTPPMVSPGDLGKNRQQMDWPEMQRALVLGQ